MTYKYMLFIMLRAISTFSVFDFKLCLWYNMALNQRKL